MDATYELPVAYVTDDGFVIILWIIWGIVEFWCVIIRNDLYRMQLFLSEQTPESLAKNTALALRLAREAGAKDIWLLTNVK